MSKIVDIIVLLVAGITPMFFTLQSFCRDVYWVATEEYIWINKWYLPLVLIFSAILAISQKYCLWHILMILSQVCKIYVSYFIQYSTNSIVLIVGNLSQLALDVVALIMFFIVCKHIYDMFYSDHEKKFRVLYMLIKSRIYAHYIKRVSQ